MKFLNAPLLASCLYVFTATTHVSGFVLKTPLKAPAFSSGTARRATRTEDYLISGATSDEFQLAPPILADPNSGDLYPMDEELQFKRIDGEKSLATFQMPKWADRVQMVFRTEGRPLKVQAQLWLGPLRATHTMIIDAEDGSKTPFRSTLKFKKAGTGQILKISTTAGSEFPCWVAITVPSKDRAKDLLKIVEGIWNNAASYEKQKIQGGFIEGEPIGKTEGQGGAIRTWTVDNSVKSVQLVIWSKDVSKKSLKALIEVYHGPAQPLQVYKLQCGGGSQPYHCVLQTPGEGCMIRMKNRKFVEDGLFEAAIIPYEIWDEEEEEFDPTATLVSVVSSNSKRVNVPVATYAKADAWWE